VEKTFHGKAFHISYLLPLLLDFHFPCLKKDRGFKGHALASIQFNTA